MKLIGSTENKATKDIEVAEAVLAHYSIDNNVYQQDSRVLYTFVPNKPFVSLLQVSPKNHVFLKTFNSKF